LLQIRSFFRIRDVSSCKVAERAGCELGGNPDKRCRRDREWKKPGEIGALRHGLGDLTTDGVDLGLAEANALLSELKQRIVQSQIEAAASQAPAVPRRRREVRAEIVVMIDGAHLGAVPGHHSCHLDVTVGKVETSGRPPRRLTLAPLGAVQLAPPSELRCSPRAGSRVIRSPPSATASLYCPAMRVRRVEQALAAGAARRTASSRLAPQKSTE
jgi:hypothetical protein